MSSVNEGLTAGQEARQNSVRNNEYEQGKYLFIPMEHFCIDVKYNGRDMKSKRVVCFFLDENNKPLYARTWKISYFTESLAALKEDGKPTVQTEINSDGRRRVVSGALTYTPSTTSRIPKSIVKHGDKKMLHIDAPFVIDYKGIRQGYMVAYEETTPGSGLYDAVVDEHNNACFQVSNITNFEVDNNFNVTDELIKAAKAVLASDSQLKGVKVD